MSSTFQRAIAAPAPAETRRSHPMLVKTVQQAKRIIKIVFGFTLLLAGVVMLVTPGPGWVTIALGLAVLAAEYVWARRLLDHLKARGVQIRDAVFTRKGPEVQPALDSSPPAADKTTPVS